MTDTVNGDTRLLVWLSCPEQESEDGEHGHSADPDEGHDGHSSRSSASGQAALASADSNSGHGQQEHDGRDGGHACLDSRSGFLDAYLTGLGIAHRLVSGGSDFREAFRGGRHNVYWLDGRLGEWPDSLAGEMRQAVNRGDGLLRDGWREEEEDRLAAITGVKPQGKAEPAASALILDGSLFTPARLAVQGPQIRLLPTSASLQAHFEGSGSAAIVSHDYGLGHALTLAFDGVGNLMGKTDAPAWQNLLTESLNSLRPTATQTAYPPAGYLPLRSLIQNQGQAVDLEVVTELPPGAVLLDSRPAAALDGSGRLTQHLRLGAGQRLVLDFAIRLPQPPGPYQIKTTATANGTVRREATLSLEIVDREALVAALQQELQALPLGRQDGQRRDRALDKLLEAQSQWQRHQPEAAIEALLEALDKLRPIRDADISDFLARIDRLLQAAERQWSVERLLPPAQTKPAEQSRLPIPPGIDAQAPLPWPFALGDRRLDGQVKAPLFAIAQFNP